MSLHRKYVVFKADEYDKVVANYPQLDNLTPTEIDDAIVLRKQDIFTRSALYEYAGNINTFLELCEELDTNISESVKMRLRELAHSFAEEAMSCEEIDRKVPD